MDVSRAMHWWQDWQMRILVLGSLVFYFSLYFGYLLRMSTRLRTLRPLVWLAYVSGDALAIYALATLFNRQRQRSAAACGSRGSNDLEVLWAPVLLIHLGGQPTITAYSLEDNELWLRHAMTLVSQVLIALYVFCNWWSGERQLLTTAVLLFVVGIIKSSCKPWALRRASFTSMLASAADFAMKRNKWKEGGMVSVIKYCLWSCTAYIWEELYATQAPAQARAAGDNHQASAVEVEKTIDKEEAEQDYSTVGVTDLSWRNLEVGDPTTLGDFVRSARRHMYNNNKEKRMKRDFVYAPIKFIYKMFVSRHQPYPDRLEDVKLLLKFNGKEAYEFLRVCLYFTFKILYTGHRVIFTCLGLFLQLSLPLLTLTSVVLFVKSHKGGYDVNDVWVTYVVFSLTALHEFLPFLPSAAFLRCTTWLEMVWQCSLISCCARRKEHPVLIHLPYFNRYWHVEHKHDARVITERVLDHVEKGWKEYIHGPVSYRGFNNLRGQWTLEKHKQQMEQHTGVWNVLVESLKVQFDGSILIWHVATELCYYNSGGDGSDGDPIHLATVISKYMAYLLFIRPEMLIPGGRSLLFNIARDQITEMLKDTVGIHSEQDVARHIENHDLPEQTADEILLIHRAKNLTGALMLLGQDKWKVIEGVWVEMLCYSAARCSGYLHARSLGHGGEFLSYVWLLWSFMGMESLADRITMMEPPTEQERRKEQEEEEEARNQGRQQKMNDSHASSSQQS
ncbi:hypothetical protein U9M48_001618 [Paspalum notatum var. saurae]|uniref:DUF4220 domain-containing protein n=1 Tax=Paspalum notatum var. saurae TaxID=547442 RepID=A0AAQ3PPS1_PASNO